jgi:hypothetical protein
MPQIEKVDRYRADGREFNTVEKAIEYNEGLVANFVQKMLLDSPRPIHPGAVIHFTEYMLKHRDLLRELLDFSSDVNQCEEH